MTILTKELFIALTAYNKSVSSIWFQSTYRRKPFMSCRLQSKLKKVNNDVLIR